MADYFSLTNSRRYEDTRIFTHPLVKQKRKRKDRWTTTKQQETPVKRQKKAVCYLLEKLNRSFFIHCILFWIEFPDLAILSRTCKQVDRWLSFLFNQNLYQDEENNLTTQEKNLKRYYFSKIDWIRLFKGSAILKYLTLTQTRYFNNIKTIVLDAASSRSTWLNSIRIPEFTGSVSFPMRISNQIVRQLKSFPNATEIILQGNCNRLDEESRINLKKRITYNLFLTQLPRTIKSVKILAQESVLLYPTSELVQIEDELYTTSGLISKTTCEFINVRNGLNLSFLVMRNVEFIEFDYPLSETASTPQLYIPILKRFPHLKELIDCNYRMVLRNRTWLYKTRGEDSEEWQKLGSYKTREE